MAASPHTGRAEANCMLTKQAIVKVATLANGSLYKLLGRHILRQEMCMDSTSTMVFLECPVSR